MSLSEGLPEVIDAKTDAQTILLRTIIHEQRTARQEVSAVYHAVNQVQLSVTRLEAANLPEAIKGLTSRIELLETDRTKRTGMSEGLKYVVSMWPMWALLMAILVLYLKKGSP